MEQSPALRKAMLIARNEIGLSRQERLELVEQRVTFGRPVASWNELTEEELGRLLDALEGFLAVVQLLAMRRPAPAARAS